MNQIALIVHTCDRYRLLYRGFEYFFQKHFPYQNTSISCYFLTEESDYQSPIFTNIKTGRGEWSDRLLRGLQQIPEPYIIYFQEDMWLTRPVDSDTLTQIVDFTLANHIALFKLSSTPVYQTVPTANAINGLAVTRLDNQMSQFLMSHQVSIWQKKFLAAQLQFKEHPWRNERKGSARLKKLNPEIFHIDLFNENGHPPINANENGAKTSCYFTISKNALLTDNVLPFIEAMEADMDALIREYAHTLRRNLQNQITHDGLAKPRKEDIFKRLKNYLKRG